MKSNDNNNNKKTFNGPLSRSTHKNIYLLIPSLCGYDTTSLINFLHFLQSLVYSLHSCHVWQSFSTPSLQIFFGLPLDRLCIPLHNPCIFSSNHSCPFLKHAHTISSYLVIMSSIPRFSQHITRKPICYFNTTCPTQSFSSYSKLHNVSRDHCH